MMVKWEKAVSLAAAMLFSASQAQAAQIVQAASVPHYGFLETWFDAFDPRLGRLETVSLDFVTNAKYSFVGEPTGRDKTIIPLTASSTIYYSVVNLGLRNNPDPVYIDTLVERASVRTKESEVALFDPQRPYEFVAKDNFYSVRYGQNLLPYFTRQGDPKEGLPEFVIVTGWALGGFLPVDFPLPEGVYIGDSGNSLAATLTYSYAPVPEPATWAMLLAGGFGLSASLRVRRRTLQHA